MGIQDYDQYQDQPQYDQYNRPVYPGAPAYDQQTYYDPAAALRQAIDFGNPVDRWGDVQAVWANVDPGYLTEQILATFPDID